MRNLPKINEKYWLSLAWVSIFGTNTGDFVARYMHMGHLSGLPYMALIFAAILLLERQTRGSVMYFWLALVTMRTAATNVGDAFHDFGIDLAYAVLISFVLFAISVLVYKRRAGAGKSYEGTVRVDSVYWVCMMLAGILGTVGGDFASFRVGLTPPGATVVFAMLMVASIFWFGRKGNLLDPVPYWLTVALARTGGTAAGDALAHALKLPLSTALTGLGFVGLVIYFYGWQSTNEAKMAARS